MFVFIHVLSEEYAKEYRLFGFESVVINVGLCSFSPEDNREGTGSIYGVSNDKFVMRVSLQGCLNKMGNFRAFLSTVFVFVIFELCLVCCDITDGNAEHLKREHSLMKPYQGKTTRLARQLT